MKRSGIIDKKWKICMLAVIVLSGIYFLLRYNTHINTEEDPLIFFYGEDNEVPACTAELFGMRISSVSETDNIDWKKIGNYKVTYCARLGFVPMKSKKVNVEVVDVDAPKLKLTDSSILYIKTGQKDYMPSYTVSDNYDQQSDISVSLKGDIDVNQPGFYKNIVQACDTSGNCSSRQIIINVGEAKPDFTPGVFHLSDYDPEGMTLYKSGENPELSELQFNEIWWVGDSNYVNMGMYGGLNPERVVARMALGPSTWDLPMFYDNVQTQEDIHYYVKKYMPKYMIIGMGLAEVGNNPQKLAEEYGKCIEDLHSIDPDLNIIISAIMPITKGSTSVKCTQKEINETNYELLRMAEEKKVRMIDCSEKLANPDTGYAVDWYYLEDGYHVMAAYYPLITDFVKCTVNLEEYVDEKE